MTDDAATVVRLRVHQFARLRGVKPKTIWLWIDQGKIMAEKDEGGHRWWILLRKRTTKDRRTTPNNADLRLGDDEIA